MNDLRAASPLFLGVLLLTAGPPAMAAHVTDVASAFDEGNPYDFNLQVSYDRSLKRGAIKRERVDASSPDQIDVFKDLRFSQIRHTLSVRAEAAIYRDLALHLELPIVLSDTRGLSFAQNGGDSCGTPAEQHCVTVNNSTLVADRFLPDSVVSRMTGDQVAIAGDSHDEGMFYLPKRSGLDQLYLGLSWAPINQRRDPTKPTWVIGFEARIAIGDAMTFNPYFDSAQESGAHNPQGNTAVGQGLNQYRWWTTISKRYPYVDPWMSFYYMLPQATDDSLYKQTTFKLSGQERSGPQQRGGVEAGLEIIPWEVPEDHHKLSIELRANMEGVFEGRGYSEMWEVFANNPILSGPCRPSSSSSFPGQWNNGTYCADPSESIPYPGITSIENHVIFTGALALNLDLTKYLRARVGASFGHEQQHYITFGDAGRDTDSVRQDGISYNNEKEVNPMYRPYIDNTGRRWRVTDTTTFDAFVSLEGRL